MTKKFMCINCRKIFLLDKVVYVGDNSMYGCMMTVACENCAKKFDEN